MKYGKYRQPTESQQYTFGIIKNVSADKKSITVEGRLDRLWMPFHGPGPRVGQVVEVHQVYAGNPYVKYAKLAVAL